MGSPPRVKRLSATKYEEFIKIRFLLFLFSRIPLTTACYPGEYENNGRCCSLCSSGNRVFNHCSLMMDTTCDPCKAGEYTEHPNQLKNCLKCKICHPVLGLQTKEICTATHNTICEAKEGYYCIDGCQMARKHTACPPGEGVKEKGTPFKDTVCEECPDGTFSSNASTTEECKNWTVCETLKLKEVEPGSAEADVKCEAEHNWEVVVCVVVAIALAVVLIGSVAYVLRRKRKCKQGNRNSPDTRNRSEDGKVMQPLTGEEKTHRDEEKAM